MFVHIFKIVLCIAKNLKLRVVLRENCFLVEASFVIRYVVGDGIKTELLEKYFKLKH